MPVNGTELSAAGPDGVAPKDDHPAPIQAEVEDIGPDAARRWLIAIVIVACLLRLGLLGSRSLRRDEAWPVNLAISGNWGEMCHALQNLPMPPGYAAVLRVMHAIGGRTDWWLRLMPAASGIATVLLLYAIARRLANRRVALLAAAVLAVSARHMYHSRDLKQYAFAAFAGGLMVLLALRIRKEKRPWLWIAWAAVGAVGPWISYSVMLVLGVTSGVMLVWLVSEKNWKGLCWWGAANAVAGISVALLYFGFIKSQQAQPGVVAHWSHCMMDFSSLGAWLEWTYEKPGAVMKQFFSPIELGSLPFLVIGGVVAVRRRRPWVLYWPLALGAINLFFAALQKYPVSTRLFLFAMPMVVLLFAEGLMAVCDRLSAWRRPAGVVLMGLMVAAFLGRGVYAHIVRNTDEEIRPVLRQIEFDARPGDALYVYSGAVPAFRFYRRREFEPTVIGGTERGDTDALKEELDRVVTGGGRMWFILTHHERRGTVKGVRVKYYDSEAMEEHLSKRFRKLKTIEATGCVGFLYDLDAAPSLPAKTEDGGM